MRFPLRRTHKYMAKSMEIDGHKFPSQSEAYRYQALKLLQMAGKISNLKLQPRFDLMLSFVHNGKKVQGIYYVADFSYTENGIEIIEDVKGLPTEAFKLKAKLFIKGYIAGTNKKYYLITKGQRKEY